MDAIFGDGELLGIFAGFDDDFVAPLGGVDGFLDGLAGFDGVVAIRLFAWRGRAECLSGEEQECSEDVGAHFVGGKEVALKSNDFGNDSLLPVRGHRILRLFDPRYIHAQVPISLSKVYHDSSAFGLNLLHL